MADTPNTNDTDDSDEEPTAETGATLQPPDRLREPIEPETGEDESAESEEKE